MYTAAMFTLVSAEAQKETISNYYFTSSYTKVLVNYKF